MNKKMKYNKINWNIFFYLIGIGVIFVILMIIFVIMKNKILVITDIYIPYLSRGNYYNDFFIFWKNINEGVLGNAPLADLYGLVLSYIGLPPSAVQIFITFFMLIIGYSSMYLFIKYITKNAILAMLLAIFFISFGFTNFTLIGATGINYFLVFSPFIALYSIRLNKNDIQPLIGIVCLSLSIIGASFEITEALPFSIIIYTPIFIYSILNLNFKQSKIKSLIRFIKNNVLFLIGVFLAFFILIYMYFPWFFASIGVSLGFSNDYFENLRIVYLTNNFIINNNFKGYFLNGFSLLGIPFDLGNTIYSMIFSISIIVLSGIYAYYKKKNLLFIAVYIWILLIVFYIQFIISFPELAFSIFSRIPLLNIFFEVLNEPIQLLYILTIWIYFLIAYLLLEVYNLAQKSVKEKSPEIKMTDNKIIIFKTKKILKMHLIKIIVLIFIFLIIFSTYLGIESVNNSLELPASYTPYGNYHMPQYVPAYVENLYKNIVENKSYNLGKILFLPQTYQVIKWTELSPYFYSFPLNNGTELQLFNEFIENIQNEIYSNSSAILLSNLNIGYIVVLKFINQSETGPIIGLNNFNQPYLIFGDPPVFINYFNNASGFTLLSDTSQYVVFKNDLFNGLFQIFKGAISVPNENVSYSNLSIYKSLISNNTFKEIKYNMSTINLLSLNISAPAWNSGSEGLVISKFSNASNVNVSITNMGYTFYIGYFMHGFTVSPGETLCLSGDVTPQKNSSAKYFYLGLDYSNKTGSIPPGWYWQNGLYPVKENETVRTQGYYKVPDNIVYVLPYFDLVDAEGNFTITNISLYMVSGKSNISLIPGNFTSEKMPPVEKSLTSLTYSIADSITDIQSTFPNTPVLRGNFSNTNFKNIINIIPYQNNISKTSLYVISSYYLSSHYGNVSGNINYSTIAPNSFIHFYIKTKPGNYDIIIPIKGFGAGIIQINNTIYRFNTLLSNQLTAIIPLNYSQKIMNITIYVGIGDISILNFYVLGPDFSNFQYNILFNNTLSENYIRYLNNNISTFTLYISYRSYPYILLMKESYYLGWTLILQDNEKKVVYNAIPTALWNNAFIIPSNYQYINISLNSPLYLVITLDITVVSLPILIVLSLFLYIFNYTNNKKRMKRNDL